MSKNTWKDLVDSLSETFPSVNFGLNSPVTKPDLEALEKYIQRNIPQPLLDFWKFCNGQKPKYVSGITPLLVRFSLSPVDLSISDTQFNRDMRNEFERDGLLDFPNYSPYLKFTDSIFIIGDSHFGMLAVDLDNEKLPVYDVDNSVTLIPRPVFDKFEDIPNILLQELHDKKLKYLEDLDIIEWSQDYFSKDLEPEFDKLAEYKSYHGDCNVPADWQESPELAPWVFNQREAYKNNELTYDQIFRLNGLGFQW